MKFSGERLSIPGRRCGRMPLAALLLGSVLTAGCAQLTELDSKMKGLADGGESADIEEADVDPPADRRSLDAILDDLQRGRFARGRRDLADYIERHPDDVTAQAVMRQLTADPEDVLGSESREYVVREGDSYSALARRHLGDAGLFLLLARYNGSDNPSDLRSGETLRLPGDAPAGGSAASDSDDEGRPARREVDQAPMPSRRTAAALALPDAPLPSVREEEDRGAEPGRADEAEKSRKAAPAEEPTRAERLQEEALALLAEDRPGDALERFEAALEEDEDIEPASSRAPALRDRLVNEYHERAILRYRNQRLEQAIELWDRVLAIDPDFEPARTYRARARELQRRLDAL